MNNPLFYAVIACLAYGIGGPIFKKAMEAGANANAMLLWYGSGAAVICAFNVFFRGQPVSYGGASGIAFGLIMGLLFGIAFNSILTGLVMMPEGGLLTAVMAITAMYPLVTAGIEIGFMRIPEGTNLKMIIPGVILAVVGGIMVSAGISNNH